VFIVNPLLDCTLQRDIEERNARRASRIKEAEELKAEGNAAYGKKVNDKMSDERAIPISLCFAAHSRS
jgi:hypothetical protein